MSKSSKTAGGIVHTFTRPIGTQRRRVSLKANAAETLANAGFDRGIEVKILTGGQFGIIDMIMAVLEKTGPAAVTLATWTAAEFDLTQIETQLMSGAITDLRLIIDRSFVTRKPQFVRAVSEKFGDGAVRTASTHAKFVVIQNDSWSVAIETSMNLNHNPRLETCHITVDEDYAQWFLSFADSIFSDTSEGLDGAHTVPELASVAQVEPKRWVRVGAAPAVGARPAMGARA